MRDSRGEASRITPRMRAEQLVKWGCHLERRKPEERAGLGGRNQDVSFRHITLEGYVPRK